MSEAAYTLDEAQSRRLKRLLLAYEAGQLEQAPPQAKAQLPGPQWCSLGFAGTGLTAASGGTPGSGTVQRWEYDLAAGTYFDSTLTYLALNPTTSAIPANSWGVLFRDPWSGQYWFDPYPVSTSLTVSGQSNLHGGGSIPVPITALPGDLATAFVIGAVAPGSTAGVITGDGWVVLSAGTFWGGTDSYWCGYRRVASGDTSYTFSSTNMSAALYAGAIFHRNASNPIVGTVNTGSGLDLTAPGITLPTADGMLVFLGGGVALGTFTVPAGWVDLLNSGSIADTLGFGMSPGIAGPSGPITFSQTSSLAQWGAVLLGILPSPESVLLPSPTPMQSGVGPPPSSLGSQGSTYFDVTDPNNPQFYYKT